MVCTNCLTVWGDQETQDHQHVGPVKPLCRCQGRKALPAAGSALAGAMKPLQLLMPPQPFPLLLEEGTHVCLLYPNVPNVLKDTSPAGPGPTLMTSS